MSAAINAYDEFGWDYESDPAEMAPALTGEQYLNGALDLIEHPRTSHMVPGLDMLEELLDRPDFAVPGAALLDGILACQRGISGLQALQLKLTAAFARPGVAVPVDDVLDSLAHRGVHDMTGPESDSDRDGDGPDDDIATRATAGHSVVGDSQWDAAVALEAAELASAELGAALRVAPVTAGIRVEEALELVDQLPLTLQALQAGRIDRYRASVIASTVRNVEDPDLSARAERLIVDRAVHGMTPGDLGRLAQKIVHDVDPAAAQRRAERAHARRGTGTRSLGDGLARFYADLGVEDAALAQGVLRALAAAIPVESRDGRGESQLSADIFADLWVQLCDTGVVDIRDAFNIPTEARDAADSEQNVPDAASADAEVTGDAEEAAEPADGGATADTREPAEAENPADGAPPVGEPAVDDLQVDGPVVDAESVNQAGDDAPTADGEPVVADADVPVADDPIVESAESGRDAQDTHELPEGDHSMAEPQPTEYKPAEYQPTEPRPTEYDEPTPDNDTRKFDVDATEGAPAIEVHAEPAGYDRTAAAVHPDPGSVAGLLEALRATPVDSVDANEQRRAGLLAAVRLPRGLRVNLDVTVALSTLAGVDDLGALLKGHGVITAELARALTRAAGTVRLLVTGRAGTESGPPGRPDQQGGDCPQCSADDLDSTNGGLHRGGIDCGTVLDFGRTSYRIPAATEDRIKTRDQRCRFLGCGQPADRCQNDHHIPWDQGGASCPCDLDTLCVRHHRAKTFAAWHATRHPDNTVTWTSPLGRRYLDQPAPDLPTENPPWAETSAWSITDDRQAISKAQGIPDRDIVTNLRNLRADQGSGRDAVTDLGDLRADQGSGRDAVTDLGDLRADQGSGRDAGIAEGDGHVGRDIDPDDSHL